MRLLRVGDKVRVVCAVEGYLGSHDIGFTGVIVSVNKGGSSNPYLLRLENEKLVWAPSYCLSRIENPNAPTPKYKIGDIVRIKSREWYEANKDEDGDVMMEGVAFTSSMTDFCSRSFKIAQVIDNGRVMYCLDGAGSWRFTEGMFEEGYLRVDGDTMSGSIHTTASLETKNICGIGGGNLQISIPLIRQNQLLTNIKLD